MTYVKPFRLLTDQHIEDTYGFALLRYSMSGSFTFKHGHQIRSDHTGLMNMTESGAYYMAKTFPATFAKQLINEKV